MARLQGFSAIITGAGSGIGRASAKLFAREGAALVIADKADSVHETAESIAKAGGRVVALTGDAGDESFVAELVARALKDHGGLDACWANAGITGGGTPFADLTPEIWAEVLRVNLIGPFLAIKHASKPMIAKGKGSIICTASVAGIRSGAGPIGSSSSGRRIGMIEPWYCTTSRPASFSMVLGKTCSSRATKPRGTAQVWPWPARNSNSPRCRRISGHCSSRSLTIMSGVAGNSKHELPNLKHV